MTLRRLVAVLAMALGAQQYAHPVRGDPLAAAVPRRAVGHQAFTSRVADGSAGAGGWALQDTSSSPKEEKFRVPKAKPRYKGTGEDTSKQKGEDDDSSGFGDCLGDCFFDVLSSAFHHSAEDRAAPPAVEPAPALLSSLAWVAGTAAMIMPADSTSEEVDVWSTPGGDIDRDTVVRRLRLGSDVTVDSIRTLSDGDWALVRAGEERSAAGWLRTADLVARRPEAVAVAPSAPPPPRAPVEPVAARSFAVLLEPSWFAVGPRDVNLEYDGGGWRMGGRAFHRIGAGLHLGLGAGYSEARGTPRFDYITSSRIDSPQRSRLQIADVALFVGQDVEIPGAILHWSLGPTIGWVRESADILYRVVQGSSIVSTGVETQSLERWRPGVELGLGVGRRVGPVRLDLVARGFAIDWRSNREKSLTLDFIGKQALRGANLGMRVGL